MNKVLILAVIAIICRRSSANWCELESCLGAQHIDCLLGEAGSWGENCPANKNMLNMRNVQDMITDRHNINRNQIAGGKVSGFKAASRMGTMVWNVTLANLARKNVRQCELKADGCRNTPQLDFVGQNIAYRKYKTNLNLRNIDVILQLVDRWYEQISDAVMDDMRQYSGKPEISAVAQMLKAYATRVGCAAMKLYEGAYSTIFLTCNYDSSFVNGWPIYDEGTAASACGAKNPAYPNLCSTAEVYNVNEFWLDYM